ncbi:MAG: exo-beta-N-acetylmuramidase NamZ domain-containing protein, partial [Phascolarctobacterium sp.]
MRKIIFLFVCILLLAGCMGTQAKKQGTAGNEAAPRVQLGIERVSEPAVQSLLEGKRLGLFTNQTGVDSKLRSSVDILRDRYVVSALFVPEHGLFGAVEAGKEFASSAYKGIPVLSLYGASRRPSKEMLDSIDTMVVDIQDVGVRHYTYFSSLAYIME